MKSPTAKAENKKGRTCKMLKKKVAMLLAVAMVAATVVGCGGEKKDDAADAPAAADDAAADDAAADDAAADDAAADDAADDAAADDAAADDAAADDAASGEMIKVGIINNDPNESGYRTANDADLKKMFTEENGYQASFQYSLKNDEQITYAQNMINEGIDYLLLSAADTAGWDTVLQDAKAADRKSVV